MKIGAQFYSRVLFVVALILLIAVNALVLGGVAVNRSGAPDSRLTLSEREVGLAYRRIRENSGLSLRLSWRILPRDEKQAYTGHWGSPAWFDSDKLTALGYDVAELLRLEESGKYFWDTLSREVYIVLELGGAPYREALRRAQLKVDATPESELDAAKRKLQREQRQMSRLFAIDAGLDPIDLRQRYGDRQRYLIAKGQVVPSFLTRKKKRVVTGRIRKLSIEKIYVPLKWHQVFESLPPKNDWKADRIGGPRYQVRLAYGQRFEPWIETVAPLDEAPEGNEVQNPMGAENL
jgi:hypothetical protein